MSFYAVHTGRVPGVYLNWDDCKAQVDKFPGAKYKKFSNRFDAETFVGGSASKPAVKPIPVNDVGSSSSYSSDSNDVIIYTDGACSANGSNDAKAGIGVFFGDNCLKNISAPVPREYGRATNQLAELYALFIALQTCYQDPNLRSKHITIYTDSQYSLHCITEWYDSWKKNNWKTSKGEPVKHVNLITDIYNLVNKMNVTLKHVRGHQGVYGNEQADKLAVAGAVYY